MEVDQETLVKIAKERGKEIKILERKLGKVEERYIQKHNELSDLQNDRQVLCSFVDMIFEEEYKKTLGQCDLAELESKWTVKAQEQRKTIQQINMQASEEIQKLKQKIKKVETDLRMKTKQCQELKNVDEDFSKADSERYELRAQNEMYETELDSIRLEVARLKTCEEEFVKMKSGSILNALASPTAQEDTELKKDLKRANKSILQLKEEISVLKENQPPPVDVESLISLTREESTQEIDDLRQSLDESRAKSTTLEDLLTATKEDFAEHRKKAQRLIMEKEMNLEKLKKETTVEETKDAENGKQDVGSLKLRITELERSRSRENINMEYLKNITVKYMECVEAGNYKEASTLSTVIYTVLQFSEEEVDLVNKAKDSYSYLPSVFSGIQAPGSGVSHNTINTTGGRKRANLPVD